MKEPDPPRSPLPDFAKLWDYQQPAVSERRFRDVLPGAAEPGDVSYRLQLLTQIARAQGLQGKFVEAQATLDGVESQLGDDPLPRVRYLLERGRVFNSSGQPREALPLFHLAYEAASEAGLTRLAIDAIHMLAIAEPEPADQLKWNLEGLRLVEANPGHHGWLPALYNNIAETYLLLKENEPALEYFRKLEAIEPSIYVRKDIAKVLRLLGRGEEGLSIIRQVERELSSEGKENGYVLEELAEALSAAGRTDEARPRFARAYELLKDDSYMKQHPEQLRRLQQLGSE